MMWSKQGPTQLFGDNIKSNHGKQLHDDTYRSYDDRRGVDEIKIARRGNENQPRDRQGVEAVVVCCVEPSRT